MNEIKIKQGFKYLVKRGSTSIHVNEIEVLKVTEKCYKVKFEDGKINWFEINFFERNYFVIEELNNEFLDIDKKFS